MSNHYLCNTHEELKRFASQPEGQSLTRSYYYLLVERDKKLVPVLYPQPRPEASRQSSTKNMLAVKIMLVIGNRFIYSVATFVRQARSLDKGTAANRAFAMVSFRGNALPQLFDG